MKTRPLLLTGLLALFASSLSAQTIVNGTFTVGTGSLAGWTLINNSGATDSPGTAWDGASDRARLRSGDGIYQTFGGGYLASLGDEITVSFDAKGEWNSPTLVVTLFSEEDPTKVLSTQFFPFSGNYGPFDPFSVSYTAVSADVGKSVGVAFSVAGVEADNRYLQLDNVTVSVVSVIPEPSTFTAFAGLAALGFAAVRRRRA